MEMEILRMINEHWGRSFLFITEFTFLIKKQKNKRNNIEKLCKR